MKKNIVLLVVTILLSLFGCSENKSKASAPSEPALKEKTNEDMARKYGILGEIPVYRCEKKPDGTNSVFSPFFSNSSDSKVNFLIMTSTGEIVMVDKDHSLFRVIQDQNKKTPTVEIIFSKEYLEEGLNDFNGPNNRIHWQNEGPKWFFRLYNPESIIVRISPDDLKREMAFPF